MLEISIIRTQPAESIEKLRRKQVTDADVIVNRILSLDEARRKIIQEAEEGKREMNVIAKSIGKLMKSGSKAEAEEAKAQTASLKTTIKTFEKQLHETEAELQELLLQLPNIPHDSVPVGKSAEDNQVVYQNDVKVDFEFTAQPHWELALQHQMIDWATGSKLTGSGFPVYIGRGAKFQRALISFFLDQAIEAGYIEVQPPLLVNETSAYSTGQLPDKEGQMYHVSEDQLYLIPTAEVPITNMFRDTMLIEADLPVKRCGYTPVLGGKPDHMGKMLKD